MIVSILFLFLAALLLPHSHSAHDEFSHLAYQSVHPHAHDPLPSFHDTARDIHLHAGVLSVQHHDIIAVKQPLDVSQSSHRRLLSATDAAYSSRHAVQLSSGAEFRLRLPHMPTETTIRPLHLHSVHSFALHSVTASASPSLPEPLNQWLVHVKPPLTSSTLSHLAAVLAPYRLSDYLPHNTYTLLAPASVAQQLTSEQDVLFITEIEPEWKYHSDLLTFLTERRQQHRMQATAEPVEEEWAWYGNGTHSAGRSNRYHQLRVQLIDDRSTTTDTPQLEGHHATCNEWEHYWNRRIQQLVPNQPPSPFTRVRCSIIDSHYLLLELPHRCSDLPVTTTANTNTTTAAAESLLSFWIRSLSHHPLVHFLSPQHTFKPLNKHARFVTQTDRYTPTTHHYLTPAAQLNLTGRGVVIAIGDTGVDFDSCFFHDPLRPVPVNRVDTAHRKIITYITVDDPKKGKKERAAPGDSAGHGTHTAGSVAGEVMDPARDGREAVRASVLSELSQYNGMAYGSKLVIHDFLIEGDGNLYVPENVYDEYLTAVVQLGAHISSNSWGDDQGVYDSYSQAVDRFLYLHPNHLMVMAAGNEGTKGLATIGTPACAKNVLTVGASMNHADSWAELGYNSAIEVSEPTDWRGALHVMPADFGQEYMEAERRESVEVALADPIDACSELTNASELKDKVVIVKRGTCKYYEKARRVQEAGGVLVIVVNHEPGAALPMTTDDQQPDVSIPAVMISQAEASHMSDPTDALFAQLRISFPAIYDTTQYNERRLSSWSSRGPTQDGRTKPDLIAPGEYIQSSGSSFKLDDYQCSSVHERDKRTVMAMEGTSMATPIAAGNAAILRQFFVEGKYKPPTNDNTNPYDTSASPGVPFDPSSSLLKAMLAHGTVPVGGTVHENKNGQRDVNVLPPPSVYQGHGRIQLDQVVNFPVLSGDGGSMVVPHQLFVDDNSTLLSMQRAVYCYRATDASVPFKATLAWIDPPGALHTSLALVNQFDLLITRVPADGADGKVWAGNDRSEADGTAMLWDTNNNLEKVTVEQPLPGLYQVVVRATTLPSGQPERYSLVVTGKYEMEAEAVCPVDVYCPNNCNGRGRCNTATCQAGRGASSTTSSTTTIRSTADARSNNNGMCECNPHYAGADCSLNATELLPTTPVLTVPIRPNAWSYFYYDALPTTIAFNLTFTRVSNFGDPDFYLTHPYNRSYPTLAYWWRKDTVFDPGMKVQPPVHVFSVGGSGGGDELVVGTYMVGVWGYCCEVPTVTVKLDVLLDESRKGDVTAAARPLWPTEEGCATPLSGEQSGAAISSSTAAPNSSVVSRAADEAAKKAEEQSAALKQPAVPVAVLLAFHLTFPLSAHPSLPTISLMLAEEWIALFRKAHPAIPAPAVSVMDFKPAPQAPASSPAAAPPSSSEHREATMSSKQRAVYVAQLLLVGNTTATDEISRRAAVAELMEQVRQMFALVDQKQLTSSAVYVDGTFAQCDVSNAYVAHPYAITCDDPALQAAIKTPATAPRQSDSVTATPPSGHTMSSSSSLSTEAQIGLLVGSVLFFLVVYGVFFRKSAADGVEDGVDRMRRQRPKPLVRHAVDEQQHINADRSAVNDDVHTPSSSSSTASSSSSFSSTSSSLSTESNVTDSNTHAVPGPSSSFSWFGWLLGKQDAVRFSKLEQQDSDGDHQEDALTHDDGDERKVRQVELDSGSTRVLIAEGEGVSSGSSDVKVAFTYR